MKNTMYQPLLFSGRSFLVRGRPKAATGWRYGWEEIHAATEEELAEKLAPYANCWDFSGKSSLRDGDRSSACRTMAHARWNSKRALLEVGWVVIKELEAR